MKRTSILLGLAVAALPGGVLAATPQQIAAGEKIATTKALGNCVACHSFAGAVEPGDVGPALKNVKAMIPDRKTFYAIVFDEQARNPQTVMPAFGKNLILTPTQINEVIDFLYTK
ncbi:MULTISPECIES: sulfur oxidation c-type cytochrome SoxX [Acidiphilium]|jgi:sulfur-oxidizing protein SoxX|uniref:Monoheme cytochrome SoxX (Sulfur oxidation) n=2 Tax=Acidiphilium TaxID=522 RepID=A5G300_ACICJ|nr:MULTISPECIES: sulfur oxidation c-type cytochrome SoxX [Acidiphilium]MBU6355181.1 sulfur oxidation c-type cytochrome SoxX [Rhodospirillales bacterium]ABQ32232.1 monoheme cytochrome SoxX (sulfur oxidation) [Acidiphilium cryptum JF-5]EGO95817.1 Cytochrome c, class I [Acidiphilium sp. PM]KDM68487.1 cytochrome c, class I [Acidiphilium sp. JA12-A1]MBS3025370.1 sulfur oxidation c-type cytochrome SoxX [Acidiphilium multivorum]